MTETGRQYGLSIRALDLPERFRGAPVSVEIIPERGAARRALLTLSDQASMESVEGPGRYVVRATLPSGQLVAEGAMVPDAANRIGEATLDFGAVEPAGLVGVTDPRPPTGFLGGLVAGLVSGGAVALSNAIPSMLGFSPTSFRATSVASSRGRKFEWGTFREWSPGSSRIVVQRDGTSGIDAKGHFTAPPTNRPGRQLLLRTVPSGGRDPVLVVWSCDPASRAGTIAADPDGGIGRSGAAYQVSREHGEPISATLYAYTRAGMVEPARSGVPELTAMLEQRRASGKLGADAATLSGYVLSKSREPQVMSLVEELAGLYPEVADLQVVQGAMLIGQGKAEMAAGHFGAALDRGAPCYTEGVRLMRDGLNFLTDLYPDNNEIQINARRANTLASAANFNSEVTCLRLGEEFGADFI